LPRNTFTFHIAKQSDLNFPNYLSENARANLADPNTQSLGIADFSDRAAIYIFRGNPSAPKWLRSIAADINGIQTFATFSGAGVLLFEAHDHILAVTFAHGWMYLDQDKFEADFGIRVAVNALDVGKLKRLEKSNLGDALQGVSQSPFQRDFRSLWTSDVLDVVSRLSGSTRDEIESDTMSGSKSLKLTGDYTLADLPDLAAELIALYESTNYQDTDFSIIDFVRPVLDRETIGQLDQAAALSIGAGEQSFELSLPLDNYSEAFSFTFRGPRLSRAHPDLMLRHYQRSLGGNLADISPRNLAAHKIVAWFEDGRPSVEISIKKALVGTVEVDGQRFAANEGRWFRVDGAFQGAMEARFLDLVEVWCDPMPPVIIYRYDEDGNGRLEREEDYNRRLADHYGFALLDQTEIRIPNAPRSGFEPCDLLDVVGRRFIHVKKSSRRSNILSHFFKQGSNSAKQFGGVPSCWDQLAERLQDLGRDADAAIVSNVNERHRLPWKVEYWIVDTLRQTGDFNIPFFSKISLYDEAQDIESRQFQVSVKFIRRNEVQI
jgi:uncharacterized protein (TIGR04141 family)